MTGENKCWKESVEREREQWSVFREMFMKSFGSVCKVKTQDPGNFPNQRLNVKKIRKENIGLGPEALKNMLFIIRSSIMGLTGRQKRL